MDRSVCRLSLVWLAIVALPVPAAATTAAAMTGAMTISAIVIGATFTVKLVIALLLIISVASWAMLLAKLVQLRTAFGKIGRAHERLLEARSLDDLTEVGDPSVEWLLARARGEMQHSSSLMPTGPRSGVVDRVALTLARTEDHLARRIGTGVSFFATAGSVSPFIGLFGTVWGIMNSFMGIAQANSTSLAVVAPGIADALLATATGLVVAIPATVMYNVIGKMVGTYRSCLTDCSAAIICMVSRDAERSRSASGKPHLALAEV